MTGLSLYILEIFRIFRALAVEFLNVFKGLGPVIFAEAFPIRQ